MNTEVATTCPYCGVGCGVLATRGETGAGSVTVRGDPDHPANFGRLCVKGSALADTIGLDGRLLYPHVHGQRTSWDEATRYVADRLSAIRAEHGPHAIGFYVSGQLLTEDYYVANKLIKGFLGTANIDTNSRLCMASSVAGHRRAFGSDTVPGCYEDLERANLVILVGANAAWCHPILFQRIQRAKQSNPNLRMVVVDPRRTPTAAEADLHLALRPGADVALFNGLLAYLADEGFGHPVFVEHCTTGVDAAVSAARANAPNLETVAQRCGLAMEPLKQFFAWFAATEHVVTVYSQGVNQASDGTDKVNAIINCHLFTGRIGRPGMGPLSFTGQPNAMGGREVGGLANQLAAHMVFESETDRARVQRFWQAPQLADRPGLKAVDLFSAINRGDVKAVWIMATNPVVSLPDAGQVRSALETCELVIVSDCMEKTDTMRYADVMLPALAWGEKEGTVTNSERCISRQRAFLPVPGEAKPDWWIVAEVAKAMGFATSFSYENAAAVFREHAALSGFENEGSRDFDLSALEHLTDEQYERLSPIQWPVTAPKREGTRRLFADGRFFTPDRRARFVALDATVDHVRPSREFPLVFNTGRVRDQWHTMTRTGKSVRLMEHTAGPAISVNPGDAQCYGFRDGELVRVRSPRGSFIIPVQIDASVRLGNVFAPIHWNEQFSSLPSVGLVIHPNVDPISGQPALKATAVALEPVTVAWRGFVLSRSDIALHDTVYWCKAPRQDHLRYELAGSTPMVELTSWARALVTSADPSLEWLEYADRGGGQYRAAALRGGRLELCCFVARDGRVPAQEWLGTLFSRPTLNDAERRSLLLGQGQAPTQGGRVVCSCFGVRENAIREVIAQGQADSVAKIGAVLRAGTNCGSCLPELRAILETTARRLAS